jgi:hypothetical protein
MSDCDSDAKPEYYVSVKMCGAKLGIEVAHIGDNARQLRNKEINEITTGMSANSSLFTHGK